MRRCIGVLIAIAVVAVAGCGGSDGLSHRDLAARAGALCSKADRDAGALQAPSGDLPGLGRYASQLAPVVRRLADGLDDLKPSDADRAHFDRYRKAVRGGLESLDGIRAAAGRGDTEGVRRNVDRLGRQRVGALARAAGLPQCARSPAPERI